MADLNLEAGTTQTDEYRQQLDRLLEDADLQQSIVVQTALNSGQQEDIRLALIEVDNLINALNEGLDTLSDDAWRDMDMDKEDVLRQAKERAEEMAGSMTQTYLDQVAEMEDKSIWPANTDRAYQGEIAGNDGFFLFQQVAENTLIAHQMDDEEQLVGFEGRAVEISYRHDRKQDKNQIQLRNERKELDIKLIEKVADRDNGQGRDIGR